MQLPFTAGTLPYMPGEDPVLRTFGIQQRLVCPALKDEDKGYFVYHSPLP